MFQMSEDVTPLQRRILALILNDTHRPAAITRNLRKKHIECNQSQVVKALNDLEQRDLVERTSSKSWTARDAAEEFVD